MNNVNKTKHPKLLIFVILLSTMMISSCNSRKTHLTQLLEISAAPVRQLTETSGEATQDPEQGTPLVQIPFSVQEPTVTLIEQLTTQEPSLPSVIEPSPLSYLTTQFATATSISTILQVTTATSTFTATATPTKTVTLTPASSLQTGWDGDWQVFWQLENQTYTKGTISIEVIGTEFTASGTLGGANYSFTGRLIHNGEIAFGNWISPTSHGNFIWDGIATGQFGGSRDLVFGFCGARDGVNLPEPCYIPPQI